jgi:peptidyl-Asp metalloendopeptidase
MPRSLLLTLALSVTLGFLFVAMVLLPAAASAGELTPDEAAPEPPPPLLFAPQPGPANQVNPGDRTVLRSRSVSLRLDLLAPEPTGTGSAAPRTVTLNLFPDAIYIATLERLEMHDSGSYTWAGSIDGIPDSEVTLSVVDQALAGTVALPGAFYEITTDAAGVSLVRQINQAAFPDEFDMPAPAPAGGATNALMPQTDPCNQIDVMVVYTTQARAQAGSTSTIQAQINTVISNINTGYQNSNVAQRVRLVYAAEVTNYTEPGDSWPVATWQTVLDQLTSPSDGVMDQIHTWRDAYHADVVTLLVAGNPTVSPACGIGWLMDTAPNPAMAPRAFDVVDRGCAINNYSLAHEQGHNMGAHHDRANASGGPPPAEPYGYGYQEPTGLFRTIMAYNTGCPGTCPRVNYWSNPDVNYGGKPTGIIYTALNSADNRRLLNDTACVVANFRSSGTVTLNKKRFLPLTRMTPSSGTWQTIMSDNFEGSWPGVWTFNNRTNGAYNWGKRSCRAYGGTGNSAWAVGGGTSGSSLACGSYYPNGTESWMIYGPFSLGNASAGDWRFRFWLNTPLNSGDKACRFASVDGTNFYGQCTTGYLNWGEWTYDLTNVYTLGNLLGKPQVWIAFWWWSDGSTNQPEGAYYDNVTLRKCTAMSCPAPAAELAGPTNTGDVINEPGFAVFRP